MQNEKIKKNVQHICLCEETPFKHYKMLKITPRTFFKIIKVFSSPPQQMAFGDLKNNNIDQTKHVRTN